jgi:3-methylcrotonyl-CoA carboxylase beta subunit
LVKAATGEEVSAEELGGAHVHTAISGVADYMAENDADAIRKCRDIIKHSHLKQVGKLIDFEPPKQLLDELYGLLPIDNKKVIHPIEIINRLIDASDFHEFKKDYAANLITGFAKLYSQEIGIIGNNGFLNADAARKGAHFIQLCDQRKIPLLFLQNITGFIVGKSHEHQGIARDGAKLIHAVANCGVPKITMVIGGSYGAGNYAMAGRAYDPEFLFMLPNAKIGVMGGEQAAGVLLNIKNEDTNEKHPLIKQFEDESSCYYSTSRIWDDGIITINNMRKVLGLAFSIVSSKEIIKGKYGVYRM